MTSLWQLTNGKKFAQLIFSGEILIDCEFLREGGEIADEFVDKFIQDYNVIRHGRNGDFGAENHHKYHESSNLNYNNLFNTKSNVTFINLKKQHEIPHKFLELMNLKKLQKKCNQLHKQIRHKLQNDENKESDFELPENTNGR